MKKLSILLLDDEKRITEQISTYLRKKNFNVLSANHPNQAFEILQNTKIDVMISDIMMPDIDGLEVLQRVKQEFPDTEVIMISGHGDMDTVISAIRHGAVDYLRKPFGPLDIQLAIERTGKFLILQDKLQTVEGKLQIAENRSSLISRELESTIQKDFIGISDSIKAVLNLAERAAKDKDISVLITGENGTGKEIIARIIHYSGPVKENAFFPVNSSAIPETLLESEFFGHIKGAFTGAEKNKQGCFELASGGTLFLDEIADMPFSLQAKLLRALEEKRIKQVGGTREIKVDVRIISATNKDLKKLIEESKFRLDLYHRINTLEINIPPLRERTEDIKPLLEHYIAFFAKKKKKKAPQISENLVKELKNYSFPGNVRELKNMVERALILTDNDILNIDDFIIDFKNSKTIMNNTLNLEDLEQTSIREALKKSDYNQTKASKLLGISKDALFRRIKKFDMNIRKEIE
jgi:DNA-binding NtrC family response regulator